MTSRTVSLPDEKAILQLTIEELRRTYDWLDSAYVRLKTKTLTFLGAGLAVLTFLYNGGNTFIPHETYGIIFYFGGLILLLSALALLLIALLPRHWEFSVEIPDIEAISFPSKKDFLENEQAYLEYIKNRYVTAYKMNISTYEANQKLLNLSFYPLVLGAIILTVLRMFGT
jgi:hypothetical protein